MADYGSVDWAPIEDPSWDISVFGLGPITGFAFAGNFDMPPGDYPNETPQNVSTGTYALAGTVDNSYHPPGMGQMWPRGDLDAIDPN